MMKVILYMAVSLNGVIARENNEEDFLSHKNWITLTQLARQTGCIIWGRKTYELVKDWGYEYQRDLDNIKKVVISTNINLKLEEGYTLANSPEEALSILGKNGASSVILTGGAHLNSSFVKSGLVDEIILNIEPVLIGRGIMLFNPEDFEYKLELLGVNKLNKNIVQLHYKIKNL